MDNRDTLMPNKVGIPIAIAILIFGVLSRNVIVVLLVLGSLLVRLPIPRLQRVLYIAIYFTVAATGLLIYAAATDNLNTKVYIATGCLGLFAIGGYAAYFYGKRHPEKNPDFRK